MFQLEKSGSFCSCVDFFSGNLSESKGFFFFFFFFSFLKNPGNAGFIFIKKGWKSNMSNLLLKNMHSLRKQGASVF